MLVQINVTQGSHGDWKTGKTGKMKMVREKSGKSQGTSKNDQKSGNLVKSQGIFADVSKITDMQIMQYKLCVPLKFMECDSCLDWIVQ